MQYLPPNFTQHSGFYGATDPVTLAAKYGTPLYVYNEQVLRRRCAEMTGLLRHPRFSAAFSVKANNNLSLLRIIRDQGLNAETVSAGEIHIALAAGFSPDRILFVANNVSAQEMSFALNKGVLVSVDSVSQLDMLGRLNPGGCVAVRFNPGVGAGHHAKVVTGGKGTKFGVDTALLDELRAGLARHRLTLTGITQHIGSLFMQGKPYISGVKALLGIAEGFPDLRFVDFGGGFGVPYHRAKGEARLDLAGLGVELDAVVAEWENRTGRSVELRTEPGRYVVAESGVLLGTVHSVKQNYGAAYVGTDVGFNVLLRPALYEAYHEIEVYRPDDKPSPTQDTVTVVGNICETGDIIAKDRLLPLINEGDVLGILDAGAYGYAMSSTYNGRLRPAEVIVKPDGSDALIRKRDEMGDLVRNCLV